MTAEGKGALASGDAGAARVATIDVGIWSILQAPADYVDRARRRGFDLRHLVRPLLHDELVLRVHSQLDHNAALLRAIAAEEPTHLSDWAKVIVGAYRELLDLPPLLTASLLVAAILFSDAPADEGNESLQREKQANAAIISALRAVDGIDAAAPEGDPLVLGVERWLRETQDASARAQLMQQLLVRLPDEQRQYVVNAITGSGPHDGPEPEPSGA